MTHRQIYQIFITRRYASAVLCDGPVLVRLSFLLGVEAPRDANSSRGTHVATSSYMRPIAAEAQQYRGLTIDAAYCYWAVVEQPGGQRTGSALLF